MPTQFALLSCLITSLAATALAQRPTSTAVEMEPLRVTVLAPDGKPMRGAMVEVLRFDGGDACYSNLDVDHSEDFRTIAKLPTPKSGSLGLQLPVAIPYRIRVDVPPHAIEWRSRVYAGAEVTIQLRPGATVEGIVRNDSGKPIRAENVQLGLMPYPGRVRYYTQAGKDGKFRFERLMPCEASLSVESTQGAIHGSQNVTLESGKTTNVESTLDHGAIMRGQVTDADTGKPIAGAVLGVGWTFDKPIVTNEAGRYELIGLGGPYSNNLYIRCKGYCKQQIPRPKEKTGTVTVDLKLKRGITVTGRIVDARGKPVRDCYVAAIGMQYKRQQETDWYSTRTDGEGRYTIADLRPELIPVLLVRHDPHATLTMPIPKAGKKNKVTVPDVQLRPRRVLRGRMYDDMGKPWPSQRVQLKGNHDGAPAHTQQGRGGILASYLGSRTVYTDSLGRFFVGDLAPGTYSLKAGAHEHVIEIKAGEDPKPLELR